MISFPLYKSDSTIFLFIFGFVCVRRPLIFILLFLLDYSVIYAYILFSAQFGVFLFESQFSRISTKVLDFSFNVVFFSFYLFHELFRVT